MLLMEKMKKPVIAAVNGYALGGGLELALACDFIYASQKAKVGFPEVTLGIMPGFGGTQNLARLIGPNRANEMIFTGRMLDADKACAWGIVNEVFPAGRAVAKAQETARAIAGWGHWAWPCQGCHRQWPEHGQGGWLPLRGGPVGVLFATEDQREGMGAFVARRKAVFICK